MISRAAICSKVRTIYIQRSLGSKRDANKWNGFNPLAIHEKTGLEQIWVSLSIEVFSWPRKCPCILELVYAVLNQKTTHIMYTNMKSIPEPRFWSSADVRPGTSSLSWNSSLTIDCISSRKWRRCWGEDNDHSPTREPSKKRMSLVGKLAECAEALGNLSI